MHVPYGTESHVKSKTKKSTDVSKVAEVARENPRKKNKSRLGMNEEIQQCFSS